MADKYTLTKIRLDTLSLILDTASSGILRKAVFSKPLNAEEIKSEITVMKLGGANVLRRVSYMRDGKAIQKNFEIAESDALKEAVLAYGQINILTAVGDAELRCSKSGKETLLGDSKIKKAIMSGIDPTMRIEAESNNRSKKRMLSGKEAFLTELDISYADGRIYDKKQHKFRQICRFLEYVEDIYHNLPSSGKLLIYDLCCGKSYLSFAVYHYFAVIKGRRVKMTGVDLKRDVIEYCSDVAEKLAFDGLEFLCGDVSLYNTDDKVDMVVSLHACDIATDIVINKAIEWDAKVILSTPCCHHEMNRLLNCESLSFISDYSMLRQKLCDAATDALRLKLMEANGYDTAALELIDPEETPKNIMLRGIKKNNFDKNSDKAHALYTEYTEIYRFLTGREPIR